MEVITTVLSLSVLMLLILVFRFSSKNSKLKTEVSQLKTEVSQLNVKITNLKNQIKESLQSIEPGDRGVIFNYGLKSDKISFEVNYEVEIIEITENNNVKVKALDYTSGDKYANDPTNRQSIIDFMQNRWVSKSRIDLIIDESDRRNSKIDQILS